MENNYLHLMRLLKMILMLTEVMCQIKNKEKCLIDL